MAINATGDNITIQSIHPETQNMVVVLNIGGVSYPKVLPFWNTQDPALLQAQLQAFAQELRTELDALIAATKAADAGAVVAPSDAVNALVGTSIPVDTAPAAPATA